MKKAMLIALEKSSGLVSTACKKAKVSRQTHYNWLKEDPKYVETVQEIDERALDFAESQLTKLIKGYSLPEDKVFFRAGDKKPTIVKGLKHYGPDATAIIFLLKCKGKKRGYVEKSEIEHKLPIDLANIKITFK